MQAAVKLKFHGGLFCYPLLKSHRIHALFSLHPLTNVL